jgi:uncharacterized protein (UPF0335 family)
MPIKKKIQETLPGQLDIEDAIDDAVDAPPPAGHNNPPEPIEEAPPAAKKKKADTPETVARKALQSFVDRIEYVREEKKELAEAEKAVFAEAKAAGFDVKALRAALSFRNIDKAEREEFEQLRDFYLEQMEERI